jgi:hypothetical protein
MLRHDRLDLLRKIFFSYHTDKGKNGQLNCGTAFNCIWTNNAPAGSSTHTTMVRITAGPVYTKQYVQHWNIFPTYNWTDTDRIRALSLPQADFSTDQHKKNTIFRSLHPLSRMCRVLTASDPPSEPRPRQTRQHDYILYGKNSRYENDLALWVVGEV